MGHIQDTTVWNNENIYKSFSDSTLINDVEKLTVQIASFSDKAKIFTAAIDALENNSNLPENLITNTKESLLERLNISSEMMTIMTFASCQLSTDAMNVEAKDLSGRLGILNSKFSKGAKPLQLFLQRVSPDFIKELLESDEMNQFSFELEHSRKLRDFLLSTSEEVLVSGLSQDGLHAWGKLYNALCGSMKIQVGDESLGLARAASLVREGDRSKREAAYNGINEAWRNHEESAAAILNAINGWRLEMSEHRGQKREMHYLDVSCHQSRIQRETLDALMDQTYKQREIGQEALLSMAKLMGIKKLAPYDLIAPAPNLGGSQESSTSFGEAIDIIAEAFSELTPEMGDFARMMADKGWIDAKPTENRSPGAYCTKFARTREPRVFITYTGSMGNVITLAHELGHAYHNWVMRDMPLAETSYSMTLAETASIFAETLVKKALLEKSTNREERLKIMWQNAESAAALLINIPARFEFEKNLVEARKVRPQSPEEMKVLMKNAWERWYGDTVTEYDEMFWANKLHFSISSLGFYNYPYLFGYLFSLGIYGQKDKYGNDFKNLYHRILCDTGRMSAEDLIKKHLSKDITKASFWQDSLNIVSAQVREFSQEVEK
ncbi:MAG: M3 family oligoendopeptidase [Bacteriovoracaceae bacterium]|nr:M3 family oligoendopeptidase [Bacteriovoracaceae bacterium]